MSHVDRTGYEVNCIIRVRLAFGHEFCRYVVLSDRGIFVDRAVNFEHAQRVTVVAGGKRAGNVFACGVAIEPDSGNNQFFAVNFVGAVGFNVNVARDDVYLRFVENESVIGIAARKTAERDRVLPYRRVAAVGFTERTGKNISVANSRIRIAVQSGSDVRDLRRLRAVGISNVGGRYSYGTFAYGEYRRFESNFVVVGNDRIGSVAESISAYSGQLRNRYLRTGGVTVYHIENGQSNVIAVGVTIFFAVFIRKIHRWVSSLRGIESGRSKGIVVRERREGIVGYRAAGFSDGNENIRYGGAVDHGTRRRSFVNAYYAEGDRFLGYGHGARSVE